MQGVVRVYKRYIGTPEATQAFLSETLSKARELAASASDQQNTSQNLEAQQKIIFLWQYKPEARFHFKLQPWM
ncbi:MAG: hypothetical protein V7L26_00745 [Nostoc sp.]